MSFEDQRKAIYQRFSTQWALTSYAATVPVVYENQPYKDTKGNDVHVSTGPWIFISIQDGEGNQAGIANNPLLRYAGIILVQIFVREGSGISESRKIADVIEPIFRRVQLLYGNSGYITCGIPYTSYTGTQDGWYQRNLIIPFSRDRFV